MDSRHNTFSASMHVVKPKQPKKESMFHLSNFVVTEVVILMCWIKTDQLDIDVSPACSTNYQTNKC